MSRAPGASRWRWPGHDIPQPTFTTPWHPLSPSVTLHHPRPHTSHPPPMPLQLMGEWRVKNEGLQPYHAAASALRSRFAGFEARQVRREFNQVADALSNQAIDNYHSGANCQLWRLEEAAAAAAAGALGGSAPAAVAAAAAAPAAAPQQSWLTAGAAQKAAAAVGSSKGAAERQEENGSEEEQEEEPLKRARLD